MQVILKSKARELDLMCVDDALPDWKEDHGLDVGRYKTKVAMGCPPASLIYLPLEGDPKAHASSEKKVGFMSTVRKDISISRGIPYPTGYITGIPYALSLISWSGRS